MTCSLPRAYAVFCGRFIITVDGDYMYLYAQNKVNSPQFSSIFEISVVVLPFVGPISDYLFHPIRNQMLDQSMIIFFIQSAAKEVTCNNQPLGHLFNEMDLPKPMAYKSNRKKVFSEY